MQNKSDEWFIIAQAAIEANKKDIRANNQDSDEIMTKLTEEFKKMLASIIDQINTLKSLSTQKYS